MKSEKGAFRADVFDYAASNFGTQPEYLWAKFPDIAVLRAPSGKWFGIVMDVERAKLGLKGEGKVDILDVKCQPFAVEIFLQQQGFVPAYHLPKRTWVGALLDGTADKGQIFDALDESFRLAETKKRKTKE